MDAIEDFAETEHGDVKKLKNVEPSEWRLRVGDWRVRFAYRTDDDVLMILRVLHRRDAYR